MDTEIIQGFIEEAESYLPTLRGGILICSQEARYDDALELSRRQAHTIKGAALMVGLENIGKIAADLEKEIAKLVAERKPPTGEQSRDLLDKVAQIEALLIKEHFSNEDFAFDFGDFVEESFVNLKMIESPVEIEIEDAVEVEEVSETEVESESWGESEIDDETREVFALEAEDLLRNIGANLLKLEKSPNDREALLEIRRNSHTLKGSAGILGFKTISKLAHHVEDLLDWLSENGFAGNQNIFQLLLSSNDCLNSLVNEGDSPPLSQKIKSLENQFEKIKKSLQVPVVEQSAQNEPEPENEPSVKMPETVIQTANANNQGRSVIRVSLDKLDDLVRIVSEMVISRSVFEQRLAELSMQVEELQNSTRRLSHSTGKLEIDFEADMLGSAKRFNQSPFGFSANKTSNENDLLEFDSLEFDRYTEFHQTTRELVETTGDTFAINSELETLRGNLEVLFDRQRRLIEEMQDKLLRLRMVSFGSLGNRLQRTVRVTAEQDEKGVELTIDGEQLEIDTQILDSLIEPLLHLLRNAVAHGIENPDTRRLIGKPETGKINLKIYSEGMHIIVSVSDDGRGISTNALKEKAVKIGAITPEQAAAMNEEESLNLIFLPGVTTAEAINYVSGRGVGMNIVQTTIERQQGTITVKSENQKGTSFLIRLPMSLAITRALLVKANEQIMLFR